MNRFPVVRLVIPADFAFSRRFICQFVKNINGKSGISIPVSSENSFMKLMKSDRRMLGPRFGKRDQA